MAIRKVALRKRCPFSRNRFVHRVVAAHPILNRESCGVRVGPGDFESIDGLRCAEINHDPLRMERVAFGGESCGKIWITFPVTCGVAVGQTRIAVRGAAVARVSTMRKWIAVGSTQCAGRFGIADEIAAFACGIAPGAIWVPVPRGDAELRILPVGDWPPSGRERFLDRFRAKHFLELFGGQNIERSTEC